jgi:hypothetical protein
MRGIASRLALLFLLAPFIQLVSCRVVTEPLIAQGQVDHINVYTGGVVEAGDTITATAEAFQSNGIMTAWFSPRVWSVSDGSTVDIRGVTGPSSVLLAALRPGTAQVSARIGDVEGSASLRVIPRLAPITLTPSVVSMRLGDSVQVVADIRTAAGVPITDLNVSWRAQDYGVVTTSCCSASAWLRSSRQYGATGTTTVTAIVAHATGALTVTVTP